MSENKRTGGGRSARGYYIALILCAAAVGITSYVYSRTAIEEEEVLLHEQQIIPVGTMMPEEDIPVLATEAPAQPKQTIPTESTPRPSVSKKLKTQVPVSGQQIYDYSMEALSYNETTRDWRVHNGVDFAAEEGTPVCAAADGTVYTIYEDDAMGNTVVIRHEGGYTTRYASLSGDLAVKVGDPVTVGQTIGYAGSTALVETTMGSHVHFSVTSQDNPMNPADFFALGN